jgi:hypothetical protein
MWNISATKKTITLTLNRNTLIVMLMFFVSNPAPVHDASVSDRSAFNDEFRPCVDQDRHARASRRRTHPTSRSRHGELAARSDADMAKALNQTGVQASMQANELPENAPQWWRQNELCVRRAPRADSYRALPSSAGDTGLPHPALELENEPGEKGSVCTSAVLSSTPGSASKDH